jgi:hypothetical protein
LGISAVNCLTLWSSGEAIDLMDSKCREIDRSAVVSGRTSEVFWVIFLVVCREARRHVRNAGAWSMIKVSSLKWKTTENIIFGLYSVSTIHAVGSYSYMLPPFRKHAILAQHHVLVS